LLEDRLLVWKLKRGSREALCRIYEKYRDDLLRIAAGLLNQMTIAEDVVQDVFADFIHSADKFKLTGSLKGYLAVCVANKARNAIRSQSRQRTISLDDGEIEIPDFHRPDHWIICDEEFGRLNKALAQLPYEQKEVVILHIQGNMKFRDIAKLQEASTKTAQSRYRYGIIKLRSILATESTEVTEKKQNIVFVAKNSEAPK
jgi:RNA polymerase sigma-70 factor (ECF subfamily)